MAEVHADDLKQSLEAFAWGSDVGEALYFRGELSERESDSNRSGRCLSRVP